MYINEDVKKMLIRGGAVFFIVYKLEFISDSEHFLSIKPKKLGPFKKKKTILMVLH